MPLESATHITDLNTSNPVGSTDKVQTLDDHVRLIKSVLKTDLNLAGAVTASHTELNILDGATLSTAELNLLDGVTASTAELNIVDGVTLTAAQINDAALKGASSNTFTGALQQISQASGNPQWLVTDTTSIAKMQVVTPDSGAIYLGAESAHALKLITNNTERLTISAAGAVSIAGGTVWHSSNDGTGSGLDADTVDGIHAATIIQTTGDQSMSGTKTFSGTLSVSGTINAPNIANSTSTTLVAGQLHFVSGDCTLPNLTAGQWIQIINDDSSAHTISVNGSDTTFWALTGATISTSFTLAARGVLTARCNPAGTGVYVTGSGITGAS